MFRSDLLLESKNYGVKDVMLTYLSQPKVIVVNYKKHNDVQYIQRYFNQTINPWSEDNFNVLINDMKSIFN